MKINNKKKQDCRKFKINQDKNPTVWQKNILKNDKFYETNGKDIWEVENNFSKI